MFSGVFLFAGGPHQPHAEVGVAEVGVLTNLTLSLHIYFC